MSWWWIAVLLLCVEIFFLILLYALCKSSGDADEALAILEEARLTAVLDEDDK
jgi:hypothetical protein